jgi:Ca2+-binding EF-hand superfamily protein
VGYLFGCDEQCALEIVQAFDKSGTKVINALSLITAVIAISDASGEKKELNAKLSLIFDSFDFSYKGAITMDEMVVMLYSLFTGLLCVTGFREISIKDTDMEKLAVDAYKLAKKDPHRKIRKKQFVNWAKSVITTTPCDFPEFMAKFNTIIPAAPASTPAPEVASEPAAEAPAPEITSEAVEPAPDAASEPAAETPAPEAASEPAAETPSLEAASEPAAETPPPEVTSEAVEPAAEAISEPAAETPAAEAASEPAAEAPSPEAASEPAAEAPAPEAISEPAAETPVSEAASEPAAETPSLEAASEPVAETPAPEVTSEAVEPVPEAASEPAAETPAPA